MNFVLKESAILLWLKRVYFLVIVNLLMIYVVTLSVSQAVNGTHGKINNKLKGCELKLSWRILAAIVEFSRSANGNHRCTRVTRPIFEPGTSRVKN